MELLPLKLKQISIKVSEEDAKKLKDIADGDARSVSSVCRLLILKLISGEINIESEVKNSTKS